MTITRSYGRGNNRPNKEWFYKDFRKMGQKILIALKKYDPKRAEEFLRTGHFSKPLPKSFLNEVRKIDGKSIPNKDKGQAGIRNDWVASYVVGRLNNLKPIKENGKPVAITFKEVALLRYVLDENTRRDALQAIIDYAEKDTGDKTYFDLLKKSEIKNKQDLLRSAIRVGLDFHIPAPLEKFTDKMNAEDHLKFLKASIASQGMTDTLRMHLNAVERKTEKRKAPRALSELYEQLSIVEVEPEQKEILFNKAIEHAQKIKTPVLRMQRFQGLKKTVMFEGEKNNPYEVFRENAQFNQLPIKEKELPYQKVLNKLAGLPIEEFKQKLNGYSSIVLKIQAWKMLSQRAQDEKQKKEFFGHAANEVKKLATPKSRARNFAELRSVAPTDEFLARAHELFIQNASYDMLLQDTLGLRAKDHISSLIDPSLRALYDHKNDNEKNRKLYAFNDPGLVEVTGLTYIDQRAEYRP